MTKRLPKKIHIVLVLWGDKYWDTFLNVTLSTRLTDSNLPHLSKLFDVTYRIYTPNNEIIKYQNNQRLKQLNDCTKTEFIPIELDNAQSKYVLFSNIHRNILKEATASTAFIIDFPDHFYEASFFSKIGSKIKEGKRLINVCNPRLNLQKISNDEIFLKKIKNKKSFDKKDFLSLCLKHLHPHATDTIFLDNEKVMKTLSITGKKLGGNSFFLSAFHSHPIYIWPEKNVPLNCQTIDQGEYLYRACPTSKYHYNCHSSEYLFFELSDENEQIQPVKKTPNVLSYILWSKQEACATQRKRFGKRKYFSPNPIKKNLKIELFWFYFTTLYHILNLLPTILLKPILLKPYNELVESNVSYDYFLKKVFIANYHESILYGSCQIFPIDIIIDYVSMNIKKLRTRCLIDVMTQINHLSEENAKKFIKSIKDKSKMKKLQNAYLSLLEEQQRSTA